LHRFPYTLVYVELEERIWVALVTGRGAGRIEVGRAAPVAAAETINANRRTLNHGTA